MNAAKMLKGAGFMSLLICILLVMLASTWTTAFAVPTGEYLCVSILGGTWGGSTPDEIGAKCIGSPFHSDTICGNPAMVFDLTYTGGFIIDFSSCRYPVIRVGMRRAGICKLVSIDDAYLGGTITTTLKGLPSTLKLKADGKTYVLPVVPGSVMANGDGTYIAQFYTMDPVTGQALVPAGDYSARCHGTGGSNDGGSAHTVSVGY